MPDFPVSNGPSFWGGGRNQLARSLYPLLKLNIKPDINSLEDLETWVTLDNSSIEGYEPLETIEYPFSVKEWKAK